MFTRRYAGVKGIKPEKHDQQPAIRERTPSDLLHRAQRVPQSLSSRDVRQLHKIVGNQAVCRLVSNHGIQGTIVPRDEEAVLQENVKKKEAEGSSTRINQENKMGLPDGLKAGVESLSGIDMSGVRVHYNSSKPSGVGALAYTQGTDIYVAPGQERHLSHEAWHVVQQAQGRVKPILQFKGLTVNDDARLEREASEMGERAACSKSFRGHPVSKPFLGQSRPIQRMTIELDREDGSQVVSFEPDEEIPVNDGWEYHPIPNVRGTYERRPVAVALLSTAQQPQPAGGVKRKRLSKKDRETGIPDTEDLANAGQKRSGRRKERKEKEAAAVVSPTAYSVQTRGQRVYTHIPEGGNPVGFPAPAGEEIDYSYPQLSGALDAIVALNLSKEDMESAIRSGSELPLVDGEIQLNPDLDKTLQMIAFHIMKYQYLHTPPTLVKEDRKAENPWRQEELGLTRSWMQISNALGLRMMLPQLPERGNPSRLSIIFPGPIDISFPPSKEQTLFEYSRNKAVFILFKQMLWDAFRQRQQPFDEEMEDKAREDRGRRALTEAYLRVVAEQKDSVVKPIGEDRKVEDASEEYLQMTLGLRRSDSQNSFDLTNSEDAGDADADPGGTSGESSEGTMEDEVSKMIYNPEDSLEIAEYKRKTFVNSLGVQIKLLNRKLLQDRLKEESGGEEAVVRAQEARAKHERIMEALEAIHAELVIKLHPTFTAIVKLYESYTNKKKMLESLSEKELNEEARLRLLRYEEALKVFYEETPVGKLISAGKQVFHGLAEGKLLQILQFEYEGVPKDKKPMPKKKSKQSGKTISEIRDSWAQAHHGTARYGQSDGNNCLIYAIAYSVGYHGIPKETVAEIRRGLSPFFEVGRPGTFLPATPRVLDRIAQFVLGQLNAQGYPLVPITIHVETVLEGIHPVIVGNGENHIYIFHDGFHYWWLDRGADPE